MSITTVNDFLDLVRGRLSDSNARITLVSGNDSAGEGDKEIRIGVSFTFLFSSVVFLELYKISIPSCLRCFSRT